MDSLGVAVLVQLDQLARMLELLFGYFEPGWWVSLPRQAQHVCEDFKALEEVVGKCVHDWLPLLGEVTKDRVFVTIDVLDLADVTHCSVCCGDADCRDDQELHQWVLVKIVLVVHKEDLTQQHHTSKPHQCGSSINELFCFASHGSLSLGG